MSKKKKRNKKALRESNDRLLMESTRYLILRSEFEAWKQRRKKAENDKLTPE